MDSITSVNWLHAVFSYVNREKQILNEKTHIFILFWKEQSMLISASLTEYLTSVYQTFVCECYCKNCQLNVIAKTVN